MKPEVDQRLAELLRRALDGDEAAYGIFLKEIAGTIRAVARRKLSGQGAIDAEDIVQETLLAIHLKRHTWQTDAAIGPWIYAIARYKIIDAYRRRGKHVTVDIDLVIDTLEAENDTGPSDREIAHALDSLTDGQRTVVRAISVEGRTIKETADRLNMKETAVRVALHRGLASISARFGTKT